MKNLVFNLKTGQRGFTLIELTVALAIACVLGAGMGTLIFQTSTTSASSTARMVAVKQVESAVHWINRDAQQAQKIEPQSAPDLLKLTWVSWEDDVTYVVTYTRSGQNLLRKYSVGGGFPAISTVASFIDFSPSKTNCSYDFANHKLTLTISSNTTSGGKQASETRISQIIPRPGS